jgi:hypothetical protein
LPAIVLWPSAAVGGGGGIHCLFMQVHGRVSDIWRSYIVQRLLWDAGYAVAFAPPLVVQKRGPHNYLADMQVWS